MAEAPKGLQSDPVLRETMGRLRKLIASSADPVSSVEADVGRLRNELLGKLRSAKARMAQLEQATASVRGIADTIRASGQREHVDRRPK